jgi:hypothetical protein
MIFITRLIYIQKGQENIFDQFEDIAVPAISRDTNGKIVLRVKASRKAIVDASIEKP